MKFITSHKTYWFLVLILAFLAALNVFLPQGSYLPVEGLPASKFLLAVVNFLVMLIVYGALGFAGIKLSEKNCFVKIWDENVSSRQRFLLPLFTGFGIGAFLIFLDITISRVTTLDNLPHPPFPTSLVASAVAGIGEEIIFRLFFVSFWVWLFSSVILKKEKTSVIFWIVTFFSALAFSASHVPSLMVLYNFDSVVQIPAYFLAEILILNSVLTFFAAYFLKRFGFLAAVGVHFWTDIVWHVIYGAF